MKMKVKKTAQIEAKQKHIAELSLAKAKRRREKYHIKVLQSKTQVKSNQVK